VGAALAVDRVRLVAVLRPLAPADERVDGARRDEVEDLAGAFLDLLLEEEARCRVATVLRAYSAPLTHSRHSPGGGGHRGTAIPLGGACRSLPQQGSALAQASRTTGTIIGRRRVLSATKPPEARRTARSRPATSAESASALSTAERTRLDSSSSTSPASGS